MKTKELNRLKRQDCEVIGLGEFTDSDLDAVAAVKPSTAAKALNKAHEIAKGLAGATSQDFLTQRRRDSGE